MKYKEAISVIKSNNYKRCNTTTKKETGFMVSFEKRERGVLCSGYFPDKHADEPLIKSETEAWYLANKFAQATCDNYVNIYVIDHTFSPVKGYANKKLKSY